MNDNMSTIEALRSLNQDTKADVYIVGGFVRDFIRGVVNDDLDIVICNLPIKQIKEYLSKIGVFKPVTLSKTNDQFCINIYLFRTHCDETTAQISLPRRGKTQIPSHKNTLAEDVKFRDFTMNAMYLPIDYKSVADVVDMREGKFSIDSGIIIPNGDAYERIKESPIRMLRAVSLASRIGFELHDSLKRAIFELASLLLACPVDVQRIEVNKILLSKKPSKYILLMYDLGLLEVVMPELYRCCGVTQDRRHHKYDVFKHCVKACDNTDPDLILRLAALLHDLGKPECRAVIPDGRITFHKHEIASTRLTYKLLTRMNYENDIKNKVTKLVRLHMYHYVEEFTDAAVRRLISRVGLVESDLACLEKFPLFMLRIADRLGNGYKKQEVTQRQLDFQTRVKRLFKESNVYTVKDLKISGKDLMEVYRLSPGPIIGKILKNLLNKVLEDPGNNTKAKLLKLSLDMILVPTELR